MESLKKEIQNDVLLIQAVLQVLLYILFQDFQVQLGFLMGGLISLGNFNLMYSGAQGMRQQKVEPGAGAKKALGSFGARFVLLAGVVFFALSLGKFNPFALLTGLFSVQFALFGREFFKRTLGWVLH